eukprot:gnl/TRDRNA2_/TRDRNA2_169489_c1_seq2.p1 gnl/TRDRNA2_/TRDRNA2_169489_c1~~gnl/TRDRNA2_/TRDRNA2_169489_c1_seq2.p1  ORF type:complete len:184 (+),score=26.32 gnl/TRDRNA2_/TRDRNA2_169489_c1_seq2:268-819(+)
MQRGENPLNLNFVVGDACDLSRCGAFSHVDVVIGLHACGGLSDLIIAHAVSQGAAFAVCTCCFMSNRDVLVPFCNGGRLRFVPRNEWLVTPVDVGVHSGTSALPSCSEQMLLQALRGAEDENDPAVSRLCAHSVNALRAAAADRHSGDALDVELVSFDSKFSSRNVILVGRPREWRERKKPLK